jgi:antitoxin component YwqK of YwqJK toxin-antitoxin module
MKNLIAYILFFSLLSCGTSSSEAKNDSIADSSRPVSIVVIPGDVITDTFYTNYMGDKWIKEVRVNGVLQHRIVYEELSDTSYYPNGNPKHVRVGPSDDFDAIQYEYYMNGQLRKKHRQSVVFGCGNAVGPDDNYDSLGHLLSHVAYDHYLPEGSVGCHSTMTVVHTVLYYVSGTDSIHKHEETGYEAGVQCPCGKWEYFDEKGNLIRKETYEKCKDGKMECEQQF